MSQEEAITVIGKDGLRGQLVPDSQLQTDARSHSEAQTLIRLDDGSQVFVPTNLLEKRADVYYLPLSRAELTQSQGRTAGEGETTVLPVIEEELQVGKRQLETGRVRISKKVEEHQETINEPLLHDEVQVERVAINQFVNTTPAVRYEGDTMIIPILEEVLVVEKRLMVKEEVRVTRHQTVKESQPQTVTLRREEVQVERLDPNNNSADTTADDNYAV